MLWHNSSSSSSNNSINDNIINNNNNNNNNNNDSNHIKNGSRTSVIGHRRGGLQLRAGSFRRWLAECLETSESSLSLKSKQRNTRNTIAKQNTVIHACVMLVPALLSCRISVCSRFGSSRCRLPNGQCLGCCDTHTSIGAGVSTCIRSEFHRRLQSLCPWSGLWMKVGEMSYRKAS